MLTEKKFFSIKEAAEYLSKECSEEYSVSDIIYLGEKQRLPIGAYRTLTDEIVYLAASDISRFDPLKNTSEFPLMLGFNNPDDALKFDESFKCPHEASFGDINDPKSPFNDPANPLVPEASNFGTPFSNAEHWETTEGIKKLVVPRKYLDRFLKNLTKGDYLDNALNSYTKPETKELWRKRYYVYLKVRKENPKDSHFVLSVKTADYLRTEGDKVGNKTIEKDISRILKEIP